MPDRLPPGVTRCGERSDRSSRPRRRPAGTLKPPAHLEARSAPFPRSACGARLIRRLMGEAQRRGSAQQSPWSVRKPSAAREGSEGRAASPQGMSDQRNPGRARPASAGPPGALRICPINIHPCRSDASGIRSALENPLTSPPGLPSDPCPFDPA